MFDGIRKIFVLKDLRNRILFSIGLLLIIRILAHIPLPGVSTANLQSFFNQNQIFGLLNMFSGGTMENFSIILMGVGPYITASIIIQLLQMIIPSLEALSKEGEYGYQKINYYTRILTVPLAFIQSWAMIRLLQSQNVIQQITTGDIITMLIISSAGTILAMWLGELISERGIGNGISLIIALGIVAELPTQLRNTVALIEKGQYSLIISFIVFIVVSILVIAFIILITEGERQIPVSYARRVRGLRSYGGVDTHLPLRINTAGVIPIIFAISLMTFPPVVAQFFKTARSAWISNSADWILRLFQNNDIFYNLAYFLLVMFFTFFYTFIVFKPDQVAENLQKNGGFVPGIRPGRETAHYLSYILNRITLTGSIFLALIAVMPFIIRSTTNLTTIALGGTSLLIVISVVIETMRQLKAQLVMHTYEHY